MPLPFVFLAGIAVLLVTNTQVVAVGRFLPYSERDVYLVRIFDATDVIVRTEPFSRDGTFSVLVLATVAIVAYFCARRLAHRKESGGDHRPFWMFYLLFLGSGFFAIDEALSVHETLGANMLFLMVPPGIRAPDDVIVLGYAAAVAGFVYVFRRQWAAVPAVRRSMVAVAGLAGAAAIGDAVAIGPLEELLEMAAAVVLLGSIVVLGRHLAFGPVATAIPRRTPQRLWRAIWTGRASANSRPFSPPVPRRQGEEDDRQ